MSELSEEGQVITKAWDAADKQQTTYLLFWTVDDILHHDSFDSLTDAQDEAKGMVKCEGHKVLAIKEITITEGEGL